MSNGEQISQEEREKGGGFLYPSFKITHKGDGITYGEVLESITYRQWLVGMIAPALISGHINLTSDKLDRNVDLGEKACELADELIKWERK